MSTPDVEFDRATEQDALVFVRTDTSMPRTVTVFPASYNAGSRYHMVLEYEEDAPNGGLESAVTLDEIESLVGPEIRRRVADRFETPKCALYVDTHDFESDEDYVVVLSDEEAKTLQPHASSLRMGNQPEETKDLLSELMRDRNRHISKKTEADTFIVYNIC